MCFVEGSVGKFDGNLLVVVGPCFGTEAEAEDNWEIWMPILPGDGVVGLRW